MTAKQLRIKELEVALLDERSQTTAASVGLDELRVHYNLAISEIGSLVHQLNLIHNSRTWKLALHECVNTLYGYFSLLTPCPHYGNFVRKRSLEPPQFQNAYRWTKVKARCLLFAYTGTL